MIAEVVGLTFIGLFFGSFYGVVASRVPEGRSVVYPPSACPECGRRLGPLDLIPVVSFLLQRARCRHCDAAIPWRYLWIEAASGVLFGAAHVLSGGRWPETAVGVVFFSFLLILAVVDLERMLLPDRITLPGIAAGVALSAAGVGYVPWSAALVGAAGGFALLTLVRSFAKGGMGGGDVKMFALMGAFLGLTGALRALFWASLFGAVVGIGLMSAGRLRRRQPIPFGPFLAAGSITALLVSFPF